MPKLSDSQRSNLLFGATGLLVALLVAAYTLLVGYLAAIGVPIGVLLVGATVLAVDNEVKRQRISHGPYSHYAKSRGIV